MLKSSKPDQHETYQVDFSLDQQICSSKGFKYLKQVIPLADTERSCQLHLLNSHKKSPIESYVLFPSSVSSNSHLTSPIARSCLMILKIDCNKHFPPPFHHRLSNPISASVVRPLSLRIDALFTPHLCGASDWNPGRWHLETVASCHVKSLIAWLFSPKSVV